MNKVRQNLQDQAAKSLKNDRENVFNKVAEEMEVPGSSGNKNCLKLRAALVNDERRPVRPYATEMQFAHGR